MKDTTGSSGNRLLIPFLLIAIGLAVMSAFESGWIAAFMLVVAGVIVGACTVSVIGG